MTDRLIRFHFANIPARGALVRLTDVWASLRADARASGLSEQLLAEMAAASALLASSLKQSASVSIQLRSPPRLNLIFAECSAEGELRGVVRPGPGPGLSSFAELDSDSLLAVSLETASPPQRYQGLVPVQAPSLATALEHHLRDSEQVPSRLVLASDGEHAAGLLLQRLPDLALRPGDDPDGWNRLNHLVDTVSGEELLAVDSDRLLHRLFHEERLLLDPGRSLRFGCRCSPERVREVLRMLGREELQATLDQEGTVAVSCEFCNRDYHFDAVDVAELFATGQVLHIEQTRPT